MWVLGNLHSFGQWGFWGHWRGGLGAVQKNLFQERFHKKANEKKLCLKKIITPCLKFNSAKMLKLARN